MKIVILDGYVKNPGDLSWKRFEELGELRIYDRTPAGDMDTIIERIGDAEAVLVSNVPITGKIIESCPSIRYIGLLSTGYDGIDIAAAREKNIPVCNIPTYGTNSVSQFTIALLLEICSRVGHHGDAVREGRWGKQPDFCFWDYPLIELSGKTMGVVGFGRIGQRTAAIAAAMGMKILYNDGFRKPELETENVKFAEREELFRESDVIALHCPLFPDTRGMINRETIAGMKDGVILLNSSRGALIVDEDLAEALNSGKVYAAGLDVVSEEPISMENPLLTAQNCIITPHIAWAAKESRARLLEIAADNLASYAAGKPVNQVN
ncbi:D-2-hydroxyacid dehydrogenase [Clostridium transplantifaecale]|uniref:D-2-hydroxyacid dehydrogenase n=1 Tax=Clostridium transplantifaecale TaxID=2479838 RepID=UPI000F63D718|nr:D-2-hydroxyacid dehydrogenase [Clostridium transplantifaecale]